MVESGISKWVADIYEHNQINIKLHVSDYVQKCGELIYRPSDISF